MKLLIVDDEELTRTGLVSSVNWTRLGIREIFQADDGINGLEMAKRCRPEIILCDVRMPRLNGIDMLQQIEEFLPDSVAIFMSGYSDKEYLKAAIRLKAITYIEKPLNPREVEDAVVEAREIYLQKIRSHQGEALHSIETASRLAQQLTIPYGPNRELIEQLAGELSLRLMQGTFFTAFIVRLEADPGLSSLSIRNIFQALEEFLSYYHLHCLHLEKRQQHLVHFVFGSTKSTPAILQAVAKFLGEQYACFGQYYLTIGETLSGISRAYQSYSSAVVLLQSSFFFPPGTVLTASQSHAQKKIPEESILSSPENTFSEFLQLHAKDACMDFLRELFQLYNQNLSFLPNQVKDIYYKLFIALEDSRRQLQIYTENPQQRNIVDTLENCFSYQELHEDLVRETTAYFADARSAAPENSTIYLIKEYIGKRYMDETLSVKDIGAHVFLSTSYVCTFFKNETNQTLNQYLTEYRMEKAKQLLSDSRYKIADISSKVGYSDGNYFSKSFKKYTGFSPSEYREKIL